MPPRTARAASTIGAGVCQSGFSIDSFAFIARRPLSGLHET
jgi:hypothetical protein